MIGMVVHPHIQSQSVAIFLRGSHDTGSFIELLCHHQIETSTKDAPFWILHGAIFRLCHGMNTSGEFVDPSTGARVPKPDIQKNSESTVWQHDRPLASSLDFLRKGLMLSFVKLYVLRQRYDVSCCFSSRMMIS